MVLPFLHALAITGTSIYLRGHGSFLYSCKRFKLFLGHLLGYFWRLLFTGPLSFFLVKATVHGKHQLLFPVLNFPSYIFVSFVLRVRLHGPGKKNNWQPKWETSSQIGLYLLSFSVYDRERTGWEECLSGMVTSYSKSWFSQCFLSPCFLLCSLYVLTNI